MNIVEDPACIVIDFSLYINTKEETAKLIIQERMAYTSIHKHASIDTQ